MKYVKYILKFICLFAVLFLLWFFFVKDRREKRLIEEATVLAGKVENYRELTTRLPYSLNDLGIEDRDGADVLYYSKQDSLSDNFMIWFGTSLGESKIYYSDTKTWEDSYREMK